MTTIRTANLKPLKRIFGATEPRENNGFDFLDT